MRVLLWILGGLLALLLAGVVAVYVLVDAERLRPRLESALGEALDRPVSIGVLELSLREMAFAARDIRIGEHPDFGQEPFLAADALSLRMALLPLLREGRLQVNRFELTAPRLRLVETGGDWNFASLGGAVEPGTQSGAPPIRVDALRLTDGEVVIERSGKPARRYHDLQLELDDLDPDSPVPFRISLQPAAGGRLALDGRAGPLAHGDLADTPIEADIELTGLDLARLLAEVDAGNSGLAGIMDFGGTVRVSEGVLESTGEASVAGLRLIEAGEPAPQPLQLRYRLDYDLTQQRGRLHDGQLGLGNSALALTGALDNRGRRAKLDLRLAGEALPVDDLQALLPMLAIALPERSRLQGGTASVQLTVRGEADALVIAGPVALRDSRLAGFSIGERMGQALAIAGLRAPADTVLREARTDLRIDDGGVAMKDIHAVVAEFGELSGEGRIAADQSLDFRFLARLAEEAVGEGGLGGQLGAGLQAALGQGRRTGIGLRVTGTAEAPRFEVDPDSLARLGAGAVLGAALGGDDAATLDVEAAKEQAKEKAVRSLLKRFGGKRDED